MRVAGGVAGLRGDPADRVAQVEDGLAGGVPVGRTGEPAAAGGPAPVPPPPLPSPTSPGPTSSGSTSSGSTSSGSTSSGSTSPGSTSSGSTSPGSGRAGSGCAGSGCCRLRLRRSRLRRSLSALAPVAPGAPAPVPLVPVPLVPVPLAGPAPVVPAAPAGVVGGMPFAPASGVEVGAPSALVGGARSGRAGSGWGVGGRGPGVVEPLGPARACRVGPRCRPGPGRPDPVGVGGAGTLARPTGRLGRIRPGCRLRTAGGGVWGCGPRPGRGARAAPRRAPRRCGSPGATVLAGPGASRSSFLLDRFPAAGPRLDLPNGRGPTVRFRARQRVGRRRPQQGDRPTPVERDADDRAAVGRRRPVGEWPGPVEHPLDRPRPQLAPGRTRRRRRRAR